MTNPVSPSERLAQAVVKGVLEEGGQFIRSGNIVYILVGGKRVIVSPDFTNTSYAALQIKYSGIATAETKGRAICQHVAVLGSKQATDMRLAQFSALSKDRNHLYLPIEGGDLLEMPSVRASISFKPRAVAASCSAISPVTPKGFLVSR